MAADPEQKITVTLTRPLVLVGLMGAGKTSVGKRLAAFLDVPFHDSDHEIEAAAGLEVREIFERFGEPYFREGEVRVIRRLLGGPAGVLATGGGAFIQPAIREDIAQTGLSIWLNGDLETLWQRVRDKPTRPLLQQKDPRGVLGRLLEARAPVYALADITVPTELGVTHEQMVRRILEAVRAHDIAHPERDPVLKRKGSA
ncbi:shikimate kinase [Halovulum dunhuangense]|uniref:Shikimate kinase n=1 Tax=Halovulum dunhuangense TaxID=1505036 RepID=A0A849L2I7_9RHOB|nr:shikimate kinase [Halovulum dunhuangense]NNU80558.1 shikimate kinase [Halovulum dunhuangense]